MGEHEQRILQTYSCYEVTFVLGILSGSYPPYIRIMALNRPTPYDNVESAHEYTSKRSWGNKKYVRQ
jgi:hypothetical protein